MNPFKNSVVGLWAPPQDDSHADGNFLLSQTPTKTVPLPPHATPILHSENLLDKLNCPELGGSSNGYLHENLLGKMNCPELGGSSNGYLHDNLLDKMNCPELGGSSTGYLHEIPSYSNLVEPTNPFEKIPSYNNLHEKMPQSEIPIYSNGYLHEIPSYSNLVEPTNQFERIPSYSNLVESTNQFEKMPQSENLFDFDFGFDVGTHHTNNQSTGAYNLDLDIGGAYNLDLDIGDSRNTSMSLYDILTSGNILTESLPGGSQALDLNFPVQPDVLTEFHSWLNNGDNDSLLCTDAVPNTDYQYMKSTSYPGNYDLNSTPRSKVPSEIYNTLPFTPITPNEARSENIKVPLHEKEAEILESNVDSLKSNDGTKNRSREDIDLNKTPEQKPPKRKKHRPKVIIEGNTKRTKTSHTPHKTPSRTPHKTPSRTPRKPNRKVGESSQKKNTPKKGLKETNESPLKDVKESGAAQVHSTRKSSRKVLNFDLEEVASNCKKMRVPTTSDILFETAEQFGSEVTPKNSFLPQYQQGSMYGTTPTSMDRNSHHEVQRVVHQQSIKSHSQLGEDEEDFTFDLRHLEKSLGVGVNLPNSSIGQVTPSKQLNDNGGATQSQMWQDFLSTLSDAKTNIKEKISHVSPVINDSRLEHNILQQQVSFEQLNHSPREESKKSSQIDLVSMMGTLVPVELRRKRSSRRNSPQVVTKKKEEGALVPYKWQGTIVPFEGKKPKQQRAKVDLDPYTNKMWNFLMGKEIDEGLEENSEKNEKWWENEREVFQGRVNSFIARMRLVQGDRHFSPWKGSIVDSVIGVFLTQNVSDHLSSSAFMSLVARFPLDSTSHNKCCNNGKTKILVEEPEEFPVTKNESPIASSPPKEPSLKEPFQDCEGLVIEGAKLLEKQTHSLEEEVISSQGSFDCSTVDGSKGIKFCSRPNSESEDQGASHKSKGVDFFSSEFSLHEEMLMLHDINNQASGITSHTYGLERRYELSNEGYTNGSSSVTLPKTFESQNMCLSSFPNSDHLKMTLDFRVGNYNVLGQGSTSSETKAATLGEERNGTIKQTEQPPIQETRVPTLEQTQTTDQYHVLNKDQVDQKSYLHVKPQCGITQQSKSILDDTMHNPNSNEQPSLSSKTHKKENAAKQAKAKESKAQAAKNFDWDTLRKEVKTNYAHINTRDSLDYEAMRQASIREISNIIKERGMNNMLAARMKDFLDRLIDDHGSVDLEWLRGVPPDKAKDYLLSIRGLGLKSVECVRLLTLHHLAFPVDTNVGRIAVRLGWVPLQPLPDSLQLHLLELYPVLETVQKYLWPRLCKLDQPTLYELHYHMITFGKVFCTKSKPNCNACPMRSECRHFASAFTSARLGLPGLQQRGNAGSVPPFAESSSLVQINPPLPYPQNPVMESQFASTSCEPIIEEPTSPEQEFKARESDIEDTWAADEDEEEIPTINLNMKELTENLQNFIQSNNINLEEGDMSRALIALTPAMASIPARKLKNVSRLRTEHLVYELPDNDPLLEGMPKRESDDPSPYLFAIWTPGETANSIRPPEKKCEFQNSEDLCNEKTCFTCNTIKEANTQTVRGTLLIPCRTAMKGSFPLNGTYFQVNEMFADHQTSLNPMVVPRSSIWKFRRRTVYFGTSVSSIFKGLTTGEIQACFWRGFVCVRGFERATGAPRPLVARLHFSQSKLAKTKKEDKSRK
ncbi:hypothetical protein SAY86_009552 [Trapa natans]|uniref:HhH-GPD domain-containing protein n=1 Tax=Trapa natans TaxID=22666 RepID=A0AAN7QQB3_TRANT|nr:hypothetical protein SAY86_009552 [Trapa natans]